MVVVPCVRVTTAPLPLAEGVMVPETLNVGPTTAGARTSTIVRLYWSPVGAVSLMDTDVPASGVALLCRWTQYVSPTGGRYEWTSTCPAAGVRMIGLSKSFPTPSTHELFRVVTRVAVGAPELPLPEPVAPIAPEPFVPDVSTPVKLTIVTEDATLCERVARTVAFVSTVGAKARQISVVPFCTFVRRTSTQVKPPPVTPVTVVLVPDR